MAQFTNQAQLSYKGNVVLSNIAVGEILDALSIDKNASLNTYSAGDEITYVVSAVNSGGAINDVSVTDNLGAYTFGGETLYPLSYVENSVLLFIDGVLAETPTVTVGPPLVFSGIALPAGADMVLVYKARVNEFAPLAEGATIVNTATITGDCVNQATAEETVTARSDARITVLKTIEPVPVANNGRVTYRLLIQNNGNVPVVVTDDAVITDTFDPIITDITVTLNGIALTEGRDYTYNETTGEFKTVAGVITVPAATYTHDTNGAVNVIPGTTTLVIEGTI